MKLILALLLCCSLCWAAIEDNSILPKWNNEDSSEDPGADPKPCCLPKRWRGMVGSMAGVLAGRHSGVIGAGAAVFTDMNLGKVAVHETVASKGRAMNITAVADYKKQVMYIVTGRKPNKCHKLRLPKSDMTQCLPKTAKFVGSPTFGMGSESLKTNTFQITMHKKEMEAFVSITVTSKQCIPVGESGFSRAGRVRKMFTVGYFDIKPDIPDPKVFDPPKVCQNATVFDTEADLTDIQDYLFNVKFTL